ncbi:MAG: hypothetical protein KA388_06155 [Rhodocyclaceae bacterium]|nr:hypothetical protein [Rhodocyclaceae bacterium]MBP6110354.1 hypothetical protein [Rhodocyclaceae bacterium]MBP6279330.1 hypothetical protein [Rhodocyclaceae bacterium]
MFIIVIRYLQPMGEVSYARCKNGVNIAVGEGGGVSGLVTACRQHQLVRFEVALTLWENRSVSPIVAIVSLHKKYP